MKNRGTIKVIVGRGGKTRVQEELGDQIKVYSHEAWKEELNRRKEEDSTKKTTAKKVTKKTTAKKVDTSAKDDIVDSKETEEQLKTATKDTA